MRAYGLSLTAAVPAMNSHEIDEKTTHRLVASIYNDPPKPPRVSMNSLLSQSIVVEQNPVRRPGIPLQNIR